MDKVYEYDEAQHKALMDQTVYVAPTQNTHNFYLAFVAISYLDYWK